MPSLPAPAALAAVPASPRLVPQTQAEPTRDAADSLQALPLCWRSEAFAEDLFDEAQPGAGGSRQRGTLLRRALAAVLRR
jgi:hypothetical protein